MWITHRCIVYIRDPVVCTYAFEYSLDIVYIYISVVYIKHLNTLKITSILFSWYYTFPYRFVLQMFMNIQGLSTRYTLCYIFPYRIHFVTVYNIQRLSTPILYITYFLIDFVM